MPLIKLTDVSIAFGVRPVLDHAEFQLDPGERVGLIGRNGEGKSTLMKAVSGIVAIDSGELWCEPGLRIAMLEQEPLLPEDATIYQATADALGEVGRLITEYHQALSQIEDDPAALDKLGQLQHQLENHDGWSLQQRVETVLSRLNLPGDIPVSGLSGGWRRRVSLARALVIDPEVLLLDEPTNHLDMETILWLEDQLLQFPGAVLLVTHDRAFLQKVATRIVDLDRGILTSWPGSYRDFLEKKAAALEEEARHNALFDKKLAQEEVWIRQGIKARRTRNEGRVRALKKLRQERAERRTQQGKAKLSMETAERSGKLVIEAEDVSFAFSAEGPKVLDGFSTTIMRGDRIGLIGPNGAGKSTLIKLLLKQLEPQSGSVRHGTRLNIAYYDQLRAEMDGNLTLIDAVGDGKDYIEINGERRHIMSYLGDFLFSPARARSPVSSLSGGERNRAFLARLFSQPCNLLIMDEPTNDLDMETLELLEELLTEFDGTLILVSHDRAFLDNVVTSSLVFEGNGVVNEYVGGYSDWLEYQKQSAAAVPDKTKSTVTPRQQKAGVVPQKTAKKLSFKEQKELEALPAQIEALEQQQQELNALMQSQEFYKLEQRDINEKLAALGVLESQLEQAYERWNELDAMSK